MEREISAFDLDHTLVKGNSSASFCRYLCKKKILPTSIIMQTLFYTFRHKFLGMSLSDLHTSVFNKLLFGQRLAIFEEYSEKFVKEYLDRALYMPAFARLRRAQQLGHYTVILSNAPSFIVKRFAKILNVNEFHATEYAVDENKRFNKILRVLEGKDKAQLLQKMAGKLNIFCEKIHAYSDSMHDVEFLQVAGNPIAVNPDKRLRAFSVKNHWSII